MVSTKDQGLQRQSRGVGRIVGTAQIGQPGNIGIAGHRDGFFRGLKDVGRNDVIEVILPDRTDQYIITDIQIVGPENVSVLDATPAPTLPLVTCYPFYFETDAFGLKKGMRIDAQQVIEQPETVITQQIKRTGIAPPPPPAPKPDVPILVVIVPIPEPPAPVETAAAEPAPKQLPKSASDLPLIGLLGLLFCGVSLSIMAVRSVLPRTV